MRPRDGFSPTSPQAPPGSGSSRRRRCRGRRGRGRRRRRPRRPRSSRRRAAQVPGIARCAERLRLGRRAEPELGRVGPPERDEPCRPDPVGVVAAERRQHFAVAQQPHAQGRALTLLEGADVLVKEGDPGEGADISTASASASACSKRSCTTALRRGFAASMRAIAAATSSRGVHVPAWTSSADPIASNSARSLGAAGDRIRGRAESGAAVTV